MGRPPNPIALTGVSKTCSGCMQMLDLTYYTRDRDKPDGRSTRCVGCRRGGSLPPDKVQRLRQRQERKRLAELGIKVCATCNTEDPECGFYPKEARCKECCVTRASHQGRSRRTGWTRSEYEQALEDQGGRCAICKTHTSELFGRPLAADHNHATGKKRALLCSNCNCMLGHAKEDVEILLLAIQYLEKWGRRK